MRLGIAQTDEAAHHVIEVTGEVDLYTSPDLRAAILKAIKRTDQRTVAVALGKVPYMDSSGVATLIEGLKAGQKDGVGFCLVAPSHPVMKVLELSRLDAIFEIHDTLGPDAP